MKMFERSNAMTAAWAIFHKINSCSKTRPILETI
jgi:hypothetical protein